jgi:hypothetical protein
MSALVLPYLSASLLHFSAPQCKPLIVPSIDCDEGMGYAVRKIRGVWQGRFRLYGEKGSGLYGTRVKGLDLRREENLEILSHRVRRTVRISLAVYNDTLHVLYISSSRNNLLSLAIAGLDINNYSYHQVLFHILFHTLIQVLLSAAHPPVAIYTLKSIPISKFSIYCCSLEPLPSHTEVIELIPRY